MAGLLDFFGNGWDDPKSNAVMALAGGLLDGDFASGVRGYAQNMAGASEAKMKRAMQEAQIAKYASDVEMDKQKLSLDQTKQQRAGDMQSLLMDMFKGGNIGGGVATPNMPVTGSEQSGGRADPFAGVDRTALMLDYMQNGGKNMGEWVNKRTSPDMAVTDGYAYDKNKLGAGFMPFLRTDASGKTSMGQIGANGLPMVSAPQGALETFNAYRNADETVKNKNTLSTITLPDGTTRMVTNDALLGRATQSQPMQQPAYRSQAPASSEAQMIANGMGGLNGLPTTARGGNVSFKSTPAEMDKPRILQDAFAQVSAEFNAAQKAGDSAGMRRAQSDLEGIRSEFSKMGGGRAPSLAPNQAPQPATGFGLELQSESQKQRTAAENEAYKAKLVDTAKADVTRDSAKATEKKQYGQFSTGIDRAIDLLKQNPTASGLGAIADTGLGFIGQSTKGGDTANQLNALSGWLTANVPRMEGPQSNFDVENYKLMAGAVGDRTKPISTRLAAAEEVKKLQEKYADINRGGESKKQEPKSLQEYGYKTNDDVLRDARNTIMRNPQSKAEVERRLQSMGLSLGGR